MTPAEQLQNIVREAAGLAGAADDKLRSQARTPAGGAAAMLYSFVAGTPVLDLITGVEGVVIDARRENVVIPSA